MILPLTPSSCPSLYWFRPGYHLSVLVLLVIHDDWDFTLSAVLHSVTGVVVTATGDGQTLSMSRPASDQLE